MLKSARLTLTVSGVGLAAAAAWLFWQLAPPAPARLLPECDAIVYMNLKPLRAATHFERSPVVRGPDLQQFIDATGIVPERDLEEAAFALHRMTDPSGPNGPVAFSEVFVGRFDAARLARYLGALATSGPGGAIETYAGHTVYTIPVEGRRLRVVQLGADTLAASNAATTEQIHGMIDRERTAANPFSGSSLLAARYRDVPLLSSAWAVGLVGLPFAAPGGQVALLGFQLPVAADADLVVSARLATALQLRVEEIAPSEAAAVRAAEQWTGMVQLVQGLARMPSPTPPAEAPLAALDSIRIERRRDRVVFTATLPARTVQALFKPDRP